MIDPRRYVPDTDHGGGGMWHLDGIDWFHAPNPKPRHDCWAQTKALDAGTWVFRCSCGAIALDDVRHFTQKNANLDPHHTIYSRDYYPPRHPRVSKWVRRRRAGLQALRRADS